MSTNEMLLKIANAVGSVFPTIKVAVDNDYEFCVRLDSSVRIIPTEITVRRVVPGKSIYHERVVGFVVEAEADIDYVVSSHEHAVDAVAAAFEYLVHIRIREAIDAIVFGLDMEREGIGEGTDTL